MSPRTLQGWRQQGKGPRYMKIEGRVIYPLPEIEAYEAANLHVNTNGPLIDGNESGRVDNAEPMSIGDKKATGGRTAGRSGPSQPRPPPAASQRPGAARADRAADDPEDIEAAAQKQRRYMRPQSIGARPFTMRTFHGDQTHRQRCEHE